MSGGIGKREVESMNISIPGTDLEPVDPERIKQMEDGLAKFRGRMELLGRSLAVVMEDFEALREEFYGDRKVVTHACPVGTSGIMPCCGQGPMDVPLTERIVTDPDSVTCLGVSQ